MVWGLSYLFCIWILVPFVEKIILHLSCLCRFVENQLMSVKAYGFLDFCSIDLFVCVYTNITLS